MIKSFTSTPMASVRLFVLKCV